MRRNVELACLYEPNILRNLCLWKPSNDHYPDWKILVRLGSPRIRRLTLVRIQLIKFPVIPQLPQVVNEYFASCRKKIQ